MNLVTLNVGDKHELLFNKMAQTKAEAGLLTKGLCLTPALGVTKFIIVKDMILITLCRAT
jgi:hypothetical protein